MTAPWVDVDPEQVSRYCADKADRLRDHAQLAREDGGNYWAVWLVLGDQGLVYRVDLWLRPEGWVGRCDHPRLLRQRQGVPVPADQACSHLHAAAGEEARLRGTHIPALPALRPPRRRPADAMAGFYD